MATPTATNELRVTSSLKPSSRNTRRHTEASRAAVMNSMLEYGFTMPILIDPDGDVIAGHGRLEAATAIYAEGLSIKGLNGEPLPHDMVPVIVATNWTEKQKRAYRIADNKLTETSSWDEDMLRLELGDLKEQGYDITLTGFAGDELNVLLNGWDTDIKAVEDLAADNGPLLAVVKVRCAQVQSDEVRKVVKEALAGMAGVEVD